MPRMEMCSKIAAGTKVDSDEKIAFGANLAGKETRKKTNY